MQWMLLLLRLKFKKLSWHVSCSSAALKKAVVTTFFFWVLNYVCLCRTRNCITKKLLFSNTSEKDQSDLVSSVCLQRVRMKTPQSLPQSIHHSLKGNLRLTRILERKKKGEIWDLLLLFKNSLISHEAWRKIFKSSLKK